MASKLGVRGDRTGLDDDLAALDVLALDATEEQADVLAGLALVEQLAEHLDAGDRGLGLRPAVDTDDLDLLVDLEDAALDTTGDDGATTGDREDVLDGHEERLVRRHAPARGMESSTASMSSRTVLPHSASPSSALSAETWTTGRSSPGNS